MTDWDWDLTGFRLGAFFSLIIIALLFGTLPYLLQKYVFKSTEVRDRLLSLGNCFAGGLFLGSGLMHLLSESTHTFDHELGPDYEAYPFSMMLLPAGFFLVFFIEKVLLSHDPKVVTIGGQKEREEYGTFPPTHNNAVPAILVVEETSPPRLEPDRTDLEGGTHPSTTPTGHTGEDHGHGHHEDKPHDHGDDHDHHSHFVMMVKDPYSLVPYVLVIILSAHSIISGMAIGVQDSVSKASPVLIAIVSHKWVESFALGVNLLKGGLPTRRCMKLLAGFSLTEPVGVLIGAALSIVLTGLAGKMVTATCTALASGTFVYVAICDILLVEFETGRDKYLKFALAISGLLVTAALLLAFPDEHDE